ncbi:MAG: NusG domain II-containing protein [Lachnospiraceae bacterium]|nr:NusG domain II-containing protein [Lachnospiraceae bacterium]
MRKYFGRNDIILIALMITVSILAVIIINRSQDPGEHVRVYVDGNLKADLLLSHDTRFEIRGYGGGRNVLMIQDGYAYIEEASCPDKLCMHQGRINKAGQELICMPNRVVVEIEGKEIYYDGVTQ